MKKSPFKARCQTVYCFAQTTFLKSKAWKLFQNYKTEFSYASIDFIQPHLASTNWENIFFLLQAKKN